MYIHIIQWTYIYIYIQCRFTVCEYIYIYALYAHSITHGPWKQNHAASGVGTNQPTKVRCITINGTPPWRLPPQCSSKSYGFKAWRLGPRCAQVCWKCDVICTRCRFTHLVNSKYEILWVVISYQYLRSFVNHVSAAYNLSKTCYLEFMSRKHSFLPQHHENTDSIKPKHLRKF